MMHEAPVGASFEWWTPPELFDKLGVTFDLDVAAPSGGVPWVPARMHLSRGGEAKAWRGTVWCNPPYGRLGAVFMERMAEHGDGMLLVAARTETQAFQHAARWAWSVCFLRDRLHFIRPDGFQGRAGFGSALMAFGRTCDDALIRADLGWTVKGGNIGGLSGVSP